MRIFGYKRSGTSTSTADVQAGDFDNYWALNIVDTPLAAKKAWESNDVAVGGINDSIGTSWEDLSNVDADNSYLTQTGVATIYVSSSAIGDDYYAATSGGARIVRLHYLDTSWDEQTADAYMSGLSDVEIASDVMRVNKLEVVSVGDSGSAAGNITAHSGGTTYLQIDEETNESYGGYYYVPDGKNLVITDAMCYPRLDNATDLEFAYRIEEPKVVGATTNYIENYEWAGSYITSGSTNAPSSVITPIIVRDRCRIRVRARATGTGKAIGYFKGYLIYKKE